MIEPVSKTVGNFYAYVSPPSPSWVTVIYKLGSATTEMKFHPSELHDLQYAIDFIRRALVDHEEYKP